MGSLLLDLSTALRFSQNCVIVQGSSYPILLLSHSPCIGIEPKLWSERPTSPSPPPQWILLLLIHLVIFQRTWPQYGSIGQLFFYANTTLLYHDFAVYFDVSMWNFVFVFWLHWVFIAVQAFSLAVVNRGDSSWQSSGFSLPWLLWLYSTDPRRRNSVIAAHRLSCCPGFD